MSPIPNAIAQITERIAAAARRAGRDPAEITLIAVTKTHPPELVAEAVAAGVLDLGENRVQEAAAKIAALANLVPRPRWHLIGHLQRNKAKLAAQLFAMIHSVDSLRLAEALGSQKSEVKSQKSEARSYTSDSPSLPADPRRPTSEFRLLTSDFILPILLQVNVSGEASKEGFELPGGAANRPGLERLLPEIEGILALPHLQVRGLMTIAPYSDDPAAARPTFRALRELRDELARRYPQASWGELSMGMTGDFAIAIEEGATLVRVGRAIFGERG